MRSCRIINAPMPCGLPSLWAVILSMLYLAFRRLLFSLSAPDRALGQRHYSYKSCAIPKCLLRSAEYGGTADAPADKRGADF